MPAFAPIVGDHPKVLVLGSMPGRQSLTAQQYYAHPRNAFWWILANTFEFPPGLNYAQRCSRLRQVGVAVWDVLYDCERPGSLDSKIVRESEVANDFVGFFARYKSISRVIFNGQTAQTIFVRHCQSVLESYPKIEYLCLPSTSPAHASMTKQQKLTAWRAALVV